MHMFKVMFKNQICRNAEFILSNCLVTFLPGDFYFSKGCSFIVVRDKVLKHNIPERASVTFSPNSS